MLFSAKGVTDRVAPVSRSTTTVLARWSKEIGALQTFPRYACCVCQAGQAMGMHCKDVLLTSSCLAGHDKVSNPRLPRFSSLPCTQGKQRLRGGVEQRLGGPAR